MSPSSNKISIRPGYYVIVEFSATGGVKYRRRDSREDVIKVDEETTKIEGEFTTDKKIDNVAVIGNSVRIVGAAHHLIEKLTTPTPLGPFVDVGQLAELDAALAELREAARLNNAIATRLGSARRTTIEIYPVEINVSNEKVARRLAATICERLGMIRAALVAGDRAAFEAEINLARNLHRLSTGIQADAIRFAVDAAKAEKTGMLDRIRNGATPADAGAGCNVEMLDAAIAHFEAPADEVEEVEAEAPKAPAEVAKAPKGKRAGKAKGGKAARA